MTAIRHVTIGCRDPYALGTFWAQVLGGRVQDDDEPGDPEVLVTHPGQPLLFVQVPDTGTTDDRAHLDLQPELPREQEVQRLVALGATVQADRTQPDGSGWVVLADPEGNELCVERAAPEPVDTGWRPLPEIHTADERTMLEGMLEWYREGVLRKVDGMQQADATSSPLRTGTSAAELVKHLAYVEDGWFTADLARRPMPDPWARAPFDADPDWEFRSAIDEPLADTTGRGTVFSLRFVYLHMVEETARHLGHLDLLRELADGTTGD